MVQTSNSKLDCNGLADRWQQLLLLLACVLACLRACVLAAAAACLCAYVLACLLLLLLLLLLTTDAACVQMPNEFT